MPLLADRVKESTTTQGTGTLTLAGAATGFRSFTGAFGNGVSVYYVIAGPAEWEIGIGTTGAGTLSRDTVLVSSAGGTTKVNFSAGTKDVFCSYVADRAVTTSDAATLTNKTIDDYTNNVGANSTHFRIKAGATLAKGDVVKASGFTPGEQAIEVVKTASATDVALGIVEQALSTGEFGTAVVIGELFDVNTNGLSVGATVYQNGAGGFTTTKPSSGLFQALGWVVRANTNNGVLAVNVVNPQYVEVSTNTANTLVLRDGSGNFSAGTITAALTGNAATATALQTARNINGVSFNGTADITVTAAAGTLTGNTLASGVTASSLTSVGTLTSLTVSGNITASGGTADGITYLNASKVLTTSANLKYSGTNLSLTSGSFESDNAGNGLVVSKFGIGPKNAIRSPASFDDVLLINDSASGFSNVDIYTAGSQRLRLDSSGNLAVDTNTLFVDAANNAVGIGTTSPLAIASSNLLQISNGNLAVLAITASSDVADQKHWFWQVGSAIGAGTFRLRVTNDAASAGENAYIVTRSGTSVQTHQWLTGGTERARITAAGNVVMGGSVALATNATDGFLYVPTCAGTPTGTPTAITGMAPIVVDTTNNKLYFYSSAAWRDAGP